LSKCMPTSKNGSLSPAAQHFLELVLQLRPHVAAFDCDGTLWSGDAGETFFDWEIKRGVVTPEVARAMRARYAEYKAGKVSEDDMCGEMVTMHERLAEAVVMEAATEFMSSAFPGGVFPEMQELVNRLRDAECDIWAVSSSNEWVIRAGVKQFGIPPDRILAAKVELDGNLVTNRLVRVPSGPGKPKVLRQVVNKTIDAAFGNSKWDVDMLAHARHAFAINPNPDLEAWAQQQGWTVYFPDAIARPTGSRTAVAASAKPDPSPPDEAGGLAN